MATLKVETISKDIQLVTFSPPEGISVVVGGGSCGGAGGGDVGDGGGDGGGVTILGNGEVGGGDIMVLEGTIVVVEVLEPTKKKVPAIGSPRDVLVAKAEMLKPCLKSVPFTPLKNAGAVTLKSLGCW